MCGIVAISAPPGRSYPIDRSLAAIRHRGPDAEGTFAMPDGRCVLGHVRLAILDLSSAGRQPMSDASGRYVITYNGEIYNYLELRRLLERRHGPIAWRTQTDTEVILEGVAREGVRFLDHLNGIFALAICDTRTGELHVLRDPIGIKPLFVTQQRGATFFCSELKGLLAIPDLARTLRVRSLAEQVAFMYIPEPHTPFVEHTKLAPGICFTYQGGELQSETSLFSHLNGGTPFRTEGEAVDSLRESFAASVRRQLASDVPVSVALSGGLDSSAVAYYAAKQGGVIKDAYTIAVCTEDRRHDAQGDDLHYARLVARQLGLVLNVIPARRDFLSLLSELIAFMEDGIADPAAINTYLICRGARDNGVKVMLSGQGADEYLGGYRRYIAQRLLQKAPRSARKLFALATSALPERLPGRFNAFSRRLRRLGQLAGEARPERMIGMYTWTAPSSIDALFRHHGQLEVGADLVALADSCADADGVDVLMRVDHRYDLLSLNLCYTDRMSMAVGVEARVPFLDFDLIRVMNAIPARWKVKRREGKHVLKEAMKPFLPPEVIYRDKAGFGLPIRSWLQERNELMAHFLDAKRLQRQDLVDASAVQQLQREHYSGQRDHSQTLFTLLVQQLWLESSGVV